MKFSRVNIVILLVLLTCTICFANGKVSVKGIVYSDRSKILAGVTVISYSFHEENGITTLTPQQSVITNKKGEFELQLSDKNNYQIQCIKKGWTMNTPSIIFTKNAHNTQKISISCQMNKGNEAYTVSGTLTSKLNQKLTIVISNENSKVRVSQEIEQKKINFHFTKKGEYTVRVLNENANILYMNNLQIETPFTHLNIEIPDFQQQRLKIYPFTVNTSIILEEAHEELDLIVLKMKEKKNIDIIIECHTDSRGDDDFNLKISQEQALSIKNYLILHKISPERIAIKGFGENFLLNECKNNVKCSNLKHLENRRVEYLFLISSIR